MVESGEFAGRLEDPDLLRGETLFLADLPTPEGTLHAHFVRSPIAAGRLASLDLGAASVAPGVIAAFDAAALGVEAYQHAAELPAMPQEPLVSDTIRHAGEAVALIIASSAMAAADAADLVDIELEPHPPIIDPGLAVSARPLHGSVSSNLVLEVGDGDNAPDPLADAHRVFELTIANQRIASAPIESDGILVTPTANGLDVWCTLQGVHPARDDLARGLGIERDAIRVRAPAVGGGFGGRASLQVEYLAVAAATLHLGRPIRWLASRAENLTGMPQGRGYSTRVRIGIDRDGAMTGLDCDALVEVGSVAHMNPLLMISARRQAVGLYRIPALRWRGRAAVTNTSAIGAYRGAGQPEANHARERMIDFVARRLGVDPIDYRLEHLLGPDELPRLQPGDVDYDAADPCLALSTAAEVADIDGWREEQRRRITAGDPNRVGIGVACYAQTSGRGTPADGARVRIDRDGSATVFCGSASHGQAHRTTLAALVHRQLGIDPTQVGLVDADSRVIDDALSTGGSRSSQVLASVVVGSCDDVLDIARPLAAAALEVAEADLVVEPSGFGLGAGLAVAGVPTRRVGWAELAALAETRTEAGCIEAVRNESVAGASHPYGAHATIVEVDTQTGAVALLAHVAVDDCGVVLQPTVVEGQQHGGCVAGLSQAFWEHSAFDADGNPLGSSFMTYLLPAASEVCPITTDVLSTPTDRNRLGTRGIGENGCNGAIGSAHNAVIDALADLGIEHVDLPLTPEKIWRALNP